MQLKQALTEHVKLLTTQGPDAVGGLLTPTGSWMLTVGAAPRQLQLDVVDYDRYSVAMRWMQLGSPMTPSSDRRSQLHHTAAQIAQQLAFLEEPLAVWELDHTEGYVQLRSATPQREEEARIYWEVIVQHTEQVHVSLARYRWSPGMVEREQLVYPATVAFLGRVVEALERACE